MAHTVNDWSLVKVRPVAALVPIEAYGAAIRQQPLTPVAGSGRGLWGQNSTRTLRKLRDEWSR